MTTFASICLGLILLRLFADLGLEGLNQRHVRSLALRAPPSCGGILDAATYARSVQYTLAKSRLIQVESVYGAAILVAVLFSGGLPWSCQQFAAALGTTDWALALFMVAVGLGLFLLNLPLTWYAQFGLEERFGFNTTTPRLWWTD